MVCGAGLAIACLGHAFDARAPRGNETEFSGDEECVRCNQDQYGAQFYEKRNRGGVFHRCFRKKVHPRWILAKFRVLAFECRIRVYCRLFSSLALG